GARRCLEQYAVELRMPGGREWGQERVLIDNSRVDRMLRVLTEALVRSVGQGGRLELRLKRAREPVAKARAAAHGRGVGARGALREPFITIELTGAPLGDPSVAQQPFAGGLLERAARRLFELHGGSLHLDREQLALTISLPLVEAP
ncbi:MAG TPA: hypothetical protein VG963_10585, partial [Polyangiaceae bacterium]|nr:hypothetical protein [Polyangiaceae bacterium]